MEITSNNNNQMSYLSVQFFLAMNIRNPIFICIHVHISKKMILIYWLNLIFLAFIILIIKNNQYICKINITKKILF